MNDIFPTHIVSRGFFIDRQTLGWWSFAIFHSGVKSSRCYLADTRQWRTPQHRSPAIHHCDSRTDSFRPSEWLQLRLRIRLSVTAIGVSNPSHSLPRVIATASICRSKSPWAGRPLNWVDIRLHCRLSSVHGNWSMEREAEGHTTLEHRRAYARILVELQS